MYATKTATGAIACTNAVFGDPTPNVVKTCQYSPAATATPPVAETWAACAAENATCSFSGTRAVRYGAAGKFVSKIVTAATVCSNAVFGDPIPNTVKACSYSSVTQ